MLASRLDKQTDFYRLMTYPVFLVQFQQLLGMGSYDSIQTSTGPIMFRWLNQWGVDDSLTFNRKLKYLLYEGYRVEFRKLEDQLSVMSAAVRSQYTQGLPDQDPLKAKLACVNHFMNILPSAGIAAFDYALFIIMYRVGSRFRYVSLEEAENFCLEAAKIVQSKYNSWHDYWNACLAGAYFTSTTVDVNNLNSDYVKHLLQLPSKVKLKWNLGL